MNPHHPVAQSIYTPIAEMYGLKILQGSLKHLMYAKHPDGPIRYLSKEKYFDHDAKDLGITEAQLQDIREFATAYQNLVS